MSFGPENPRALLKMLEQNARRRFGQHFLTDRSVVQRMVRGARVKEGDTVVEVGPGLGILTSELVATGADVTAVELDRDLAQYIRDSYHSVRLVEADATKVNWRELFPEGNVKMVANLPYNVGTALVMSALRHPDVFTSVTVMLQQEVIQRLMGAPSTKAYGALSVEAQVRAAPIYLLHVPPGSFHPPPKVQSAICRLDVFDSARCGGVPPKFFDRVVRGAFAQRRKTLINSLSSLFGKDRVRAAVAAVGLDERVRAEALSLDQFRSLAAAVYASEHDPAATASSHDEET